MKRKIIALALLISAFFTLFSCSGSDPDELCFHSWEKTESEEYLKESATCSSPAVYYSVCSKCGAKGSPFESGSKSDHSYVENATDETLASAATCTSQATYYKSCEYCGKLSDEVFAYGTANAHNYIKVASTETLKSGATCSEPNTYYMSCADCQKRSSTVFTLGPTMPHSDTEGDFMCDHCMKPLKVFDDASVENLAGRHEFGN